MLLAISALHEQLSCISVQVHHTLAGIRTIDQCMAKCRQCN